MDMPYGAKTNESRWMVKNEGRCTDTAVCRYCSGWFLRESMAMRGDVPQCGFACLCFLEIKNENSMDFYRNYAGAVDH